jgi:lipopolysaccharide export LptBFGC system permease protein LptF
MRPTTKATLHFLLTLLFVSALFTIQYLLILREDIFDKKLETGTISEFTLHVGVSFLGLSLPISILVMTIVYSHQLSLSGNSGFKFKQMILNSILISGFTFILIAVIVPVSTLHHVKLLYEIRIKSPDQPLKSIDISEFEGLTLTSNYFQLSKQIDTSCQYKQTKINKLINYIRANANENQIKELLKEKSAKELGLNKEIFNIPVDSSYYSEGQSEYLSMAQLKTSYEVRSLNNLIKRAKFEKEKMIAFPFVTLILFYCGLLIGSKFRKYNLYLVITTILLIIFPSYILINKYLINLSPHMDLSQLQGLFFFTLIIILSGIYLYSKNRGTLIFSQKDPE